MTSQIRNGWLSRLTNPDPSTILVTALLVISIPLLLHYVIYRSPSSNFLSTILLIGPNIQQWERGQNAATRTSQAPLTVECSLPVTTRAASTGYRSANDPSNEAHQKFMLADTPGHGKLRHYAISNITNPQNLKSIIFMVDAAELADQTETAENEALRQSAEYLYDVLLILQKRALTIKSARGPTELPLLIAANKMDLFTALPAPLVKKYLESEITKVRDSRSRGLLDSGVGMNEPDDEKEWLGDAGSGRFDFCQMEEFNVAITVAGGNAIGADGPDVKQWWSWIGSNL
ncbi:uncharacterized protein KY384_003142 [Bacidia gigantensis]|uniref:uncharacterized protein n=1 Tax=Bacidia gigantensis TaxID=2732470 RepID=UPI001D03E135|nr:uncharacterized protein KY384_003142 [Bacidia gigantensis]KAG8531513.1 hypothetical protein KY384_003142 [Bacidia gigantensis]